jgi:hypothetical protein
MEYGRMKIIREDKPIEVIIYMEISQHILPV